MPIGNLEVAVGLDDDQPNEDDAIKVPLVGLDWCYHQWWLRRVHWKIQVKKAFWLTILVHNIWQLWFDMSSHGDEAEGLDPASDHLTI